MGIISNVKNFFQGVKFMDYKDFVSNEVFTNSLRYSFERIKRKTPEEKLQSILNFEMSEENVNAEDFANLENSQGVSLLQLASSNLNADAVEILLENGADVNHVSLKSPLKAHSPLMYALGNNGKIVFPTRDYFSSEYDYEMHLEEVAKQVQKAPKDFDKFKKTVNLLLAYGGEAFSPLSPIFTDKQAKNKTGREFVQFAIAYLDNDENLQFFKNGENGKIEELPKAEMMEFLLTIDCFKDALSPELLSYAKQNDYDAFRVLLDTVPDKIKMLREVHKYESIEMAYYHNKEIIASNAVKAIILDIENKGLDPDTLPICPDKFAYENAMKKFANYKEIHEKLAEGHTVLTEFDGPETFDFKPMPYYNHRYVGGSVVNLYVPDIFTANAYLIEAKNDPEMALENYSQDITEVYPRILKHGNINHFIGLMEEEFSQIEMLNELAEIFDEYENKGDKAEMEKE